MNPTHRRSHHHNTQSSHKSWTSTITQSSKKTIRRILHNVHHGVSHCWIQFLIDTWIIGWSLVWIPAPDFLSTFHPYRSSRDSLVTVVMEMMLSAVVMIREQIQSFQDTSNCSTYHPHKHNKFAVNTISIKSTLKRDSLDHHPSILSRSMFPGPPTSLYKC